MTDGRLVRGATSGGRDLQGGTPTRRELLEAASLLGTASLAGCTGLLGDDGDDPTDWLYAPSAFGDWKFYGFRYAEPATAFEHADVLSDSSIERFRDHLFVGAQADLALDPADAEWFLHGGDPLLEHPSVAVTRGSLDGSTVRSEIESLRSPSFRQVDGYRGFDLYEGGSEAAGVTEGTLLWGIAVESATPLETAIDASDGRVARFPERDGAADALVERLLPATYAYLQVRNEGDKRGEGYAQTVDWERTDVISMTVFESAEVVPDRARSAETWYADAARERVRDLELRIEDDVVVGTGWVPTAEVELGLWPFRAVE